MESALMSGQIAIRTEGLGKQYRIGTSQAAYQTLRETLLRTAAAPFRRARDLLRGRAWGAAELHGSIWALRDVGLEIGRGEVVGVIGRNGAGKSTLLKILSRITEPTEGHAEVRGRVGALLEVGTGFHPELTGRENIWLNGAILGMRRSEIQARFDEIVAFSEVEQFIDTPVKHYSSGMVVRLAFSVAAHLEPDILLVDEVLAVGDFAFQRKCLGKMDDVVGAGRTVLFVSHQMEAVTNLCKRTILLEGGRVVADGPTQQVLERYLEASPELAGQTLEQRPDRQGDGRIRFLETWIENEKGERVLSGRSGSPLTIAARYRVVGESPVSNVIVAFALYNRSRIQLTDLSNISTGDFFYGRVPRTGVFRCRIPRLPLNAGRYVYNAIVRSGMAVEDFIKEAGSFDVEGGDFFGSGRLVDQGQGDVLIEHGWDLVGEDGSGSGTTGAD
jgi:lipopolysaccharide transport system ATP-binding protein